MNVVTIVTEGVNAYTVSGINITYSIPLDLPVAEAGEQDTNRTANTIKSAKILNILFMLLELK